MAKSVDRTHPSRKSASGLAAVRGDGARRDGTRPLGPKLNLLLAKLPASEMAAFTDRAEQVTRTARDVLLENGNPITDVFFPLTSMISLLTVLKEGISIEATTIGYEGVLGLPLFNGVKTIHERAVCQITGEMYRVSANDFLELTDRSAALRGMLHKYSQFTQDAIAQSAACNSIHLIEQRCARWLLLTADAVRDDGFSLTQEFFAQMLAVRRSGVSTAMGSLERQNLINVRYGAITIVDRDGLTKVSCECYQTITDRLHQLLM